MQWFIILDLALLRLPVPINTPSKIRNGPSELDVNIIQLNKAIATEQLHGETLHVAGWGITEKFFSTFYMPDKLQTATMTIIPEIKEETRLWGSPKMKTISFLSGQGTCPGDSGGMGYIKSKC